MIIQINCKRYICKTDATVREKKETWKQWDCEWMSSDGDELDMKEYVCSA